MMDIMEVSSIGGEIIEGVEGKPVSAVVVY